MTFIWTCFKRQGTHFLAMTFVECVKLLASSITIIRLTIIIAKQ
jgi:hypothetical protein